MNKKTPERQSFVDSTAVGRGFISSRAFFRWLITWSPPMSISHRILASVLACVVATGSAAHSVANATGTPDQKPAAWVDAADETAVKRSGNWRKTQFRYAAASHLHTTEDGAALEWRFEGRGVALRLGNHAVPAYGVPNLGHIVVTVDGGRRRVLHPHHHRAKP